MNVLIVDDEPLARARIRRLLMNEPSMCVQGEASNGDEALALIKKHTPDVVFLDVDMPRMSGIEVAKQLNSLALPPAIVFVTAHSEHALDALQLNAAGYLVKPITEHSLHNALAQLGRLHKVHIQKQQAEKVSYQLAGILKSIEIERVYFFSAEEKYTKMVFTGGEAFVEQSLKQLEARYPQFLLRIHRNTLVNKHKIAALHCRKNNLHVIELHGCNVFLTVSRRALKTVKNELYPS